MCSSPPILSVSPLPSPESAVESDRGDHIDLHVDALAELQPGTAVRAGSSEPNTSPKAPALAHSGRHRQGPRAPGVEHTEGMARYLWESGAMAVASDTFAVEVWPPDFSPRTSPFGFLHRVLIGQFGMALGELWWLDDLAADCAEDGGYEFLLTSAPLNSRGGIGSPSKCATDTCLDVAGSVLKGQIAASIVAGRVPKSLGFCLRWLRRWLPEIWLALLRDGVRIWEISHTEHHSRLPRLSTTRQWCRLPPSGRAHWSRDR